MTSDANDPQESAGDDAGRSRWWSVGLGTLVGIAALGTLARYGARSHWRFELATHFPLQLAIGTGLAVVGLGMLRNWALCLVAAATCAANVASLVPLNSQAPRPAGGGASLRCVAANLQKGNQAYDRFIDFVRLERPGVAVLVEPTEDWLPALDEVRRELPHRHEEFRPDAFGVVVLSRHPIRAVRTVNMTDRLVPVVVATIDVEDRPTTIVAAHPVPPMGADPARRRNVQLSELARLVTSLPGPVVLLGDLNVTPWSPYFRDLLRDGRLHDTRVGFGINPTWPNVPWVARIPIDHALVSPDVGVVNFRVGPSIGSDHRPIVVDLRLPAGVVDLETQRPDQERPGTRPLPHGRG